MRFYGTEGELDVVLIGTAHTKRMRICFASINRIIQQHFVLLILLFSNTVAHDHFIVLEHLDVDSEKYVSL
jgi:hypothetical protein